MTADAHTAISDAVLKRAEKWIDPAGRRLQVLKEAGASLLAQGFNCGLNDIYIEAMRQGVWPCRYVRNHGSFSLADQILLARAGVAVIGAGGLGGHVLLLLARIGVGTLVVIDPDRFDETNLNRQALSSIDTLSQSKVHVAADTLAAINPAVAVIAHETAFDAENAPVMLAGVSAVVDALDSVAARLILADAAKKLKISLVHGAVAGFEGQMMTICPQDPGLVDVYGRPESDQTDPPAPEHILGVLAVTPALIAALQAMEVVKLLLNRGQLLQNRLLYADIETTGFEVLGLKNSGA